MGEHEVRSRLAIALDVDSPEAALDLAKNLAPHFGVAKVGYELYAATGPQIVQELRELEMRVFLDLKLHDIPTTVGKAARVLGRIGISYLNFHASGGEAMLRAGVEGLSAGAAEGGQPAPLPLAVTVLTSDPPDMYRVRALSGVARDAGCAGVVCAATDIADVRSVFPGAVTMVPGIRTGESSGDDQVRVATPSEALAAGADVLVVGRSVTASDDPSRAAAALVASLS